MSMINTFSLSFFLGVSQLLWLPNLNGDWLLYIVGILVASLFFINKNKIFLLNLILGSCCGFAFALTTAIDAKRSQLHEIPVSSIQVIGKVVDLPIVKKDRISFSLSVLSSVELPSLKKVWVNWYNSKEKIQTGQQWAMQLKLKPIRGLHNQGSFDYAQWLFRHGYDATATVKKAQQYKKYRLTFMDKIDLLRADVSHLIEQEFSNLRTQSLVKALTIGDKSVISHEDAELFRVTGTAHLIAISGLHIGLMAFVGVLFARALFWFSAQQYFNRFKYEAIGAIAFAGAYALLAGLSTSTLRALIMVMVFAMAYAFKWSINRWQSWCIALFLVVLIDPLSVLDGGLWFSFLAVAALVFSFKGRESKLMGFVKAQFVILIALMPLMALSFHQLNLLTPIINLLILPMASLLLIPLVLLSIVVHYFSGFVSGFLFTIVDFLSHHLLQFLMFAQEYQILSFTVRSISLIEWILVIMASIILLLPHFMYWRFLAVTFYIPLFTAESLVNDEEQFIVNILDVGQGLSVVIQTKNHHMIYDTGLRSESGFSMATTVVLPFLDSHGVKHIDKMIISHDDKDHAGGLNDLYNRFPKMGIYDVNGVHQACQSQLSWQWDGVDFQVISPFELLPYLGNNSSCVLKISSKNGSILLTGDIEEPVEYRLINHMKQEIKSDVLLVPHHGSRTSSGVDFIKAVNPRYAVNSSGFANQFNHPHPLIKQRYTDLGMAFYDTQQSGAITLSFLDDKIDIETQQNNSQHFWQFDTKWSTSRWFEFLR